MKRQSTHYRAAKHTPKEACRVTSANGNQNDKLVAQTEQRLMMQSKTGLLNSVKPTEQRKMITANYRFDDCSSLQSDQRRPCGRFSPTGFIFRDKHRAS
jgi:hypothetical protein